VGQEINTYEGLPLPFWCNERRQTATSQCKAKTPGSHWEENWNEWVICKHLQKPAK
jgi:hypothetical protein